MGKWRRFTPEQEAFFREYGPGHMIKESAAEFTRRFGEEMSWASMQLALSRRKISTGIDGKFKKGQVPYCKGKKMPTRGRAAETQFKKGCTPPSTKPVGAEWIDENGFTHIKVANPNIWRRKHHIIWEQAHGPIPKGYNVIFLDGNKKNFALENLEMLSPQEYAIYYTKYKKVPDAQIALATVRTCKIRVKINEKLGIKPRVRGKENENGQ